MTFNFHNDKYWTTCIFFIKVLFYWFHFTHTFYILYLTVNVLCYYNISVQTFRCRLCKQYCLADIYRYITFIFVFCFKYDAYFNLKKIFEYKGKRIKTGQKVAPAYLKCAIRIIRYQGRLSKTLFMLRIFFTFEKKINHSVDK